MASRLKQLDMDDITIDGLFQSTNPVSKEVVSGLVLGADSAPSQPSALDDVGQVDQISYQSKDGNQALRTTGYAAGEGNIPVLLNSNLCELEPKPCFL